MHGERSSGDLLAMGRHERFIRILGYRRWCLLQRGFGFGGDGGQAAATEVVESQSWNIDPVNLNRSTSRGCQKEFQGERVKCNVESPPSPVFDWAALAGLPFDSRRVQTYPWAAVNIMSTDTDDSRMPQLPLAPRPSPINVPELLHRIFDFFTDYELTLHVIPVCRLWFLLHQHRIAREIYIDEALGYERLERALQGLPYATRLCWSSGPTLKGVTRSQQKRHRRLMEKMLKDKHADSADMHFKRYRPVVVGEGEYYTYGMGGLDGLVQGSMAPLRELVVEGSIDYQLRLVPLFPFLSTLRRLELRLGGNPMNMCELMASCPSLEALEIRGWSTIEGNLAEDYYKDLRQGKPLLLQSVILGNVQYLKKNLEDMLTVTPHLRELKLFNIYIGSYSWTSDAVGAGLLLTHIRSLSLPLERFYISYRAKPVTGEFQSLLLDLCPARNEFFTWDFPLEIVNVFRQTQNTITTLEILAHGKCEPGSTLHQYLCSSPHLLHLRAPRIEYLVNHMDIHRRLTDTNGTKFNNTPPAGQPRIWACSKLETLHIGIHSISGMPSSQEPPFYEQGRVLFGCSKVGARVWVVSFGEVGETREIMDCWAFVEGGETTSCGGYLGQATQGRVSLKDVPLQQQQEQQQQLQEQHDQQQKQQDQATVEPNDAAGQLEDLGRLVDVENMVEEMDSKKGFAFWPLLRRMSIYSDNAFGLSVEQECQWKLDNLGRIRR
ncbi:MAG: hypothetical protein J3R72DRAFT_418339 [Linnemannia gamsii]|nr:MAG: hypothetical protein J3R72DRAFT_418339 [Linnemannia gamsii]